MQSNNPFYLKIKNKNNFAHSPPWWDSNRTQAFKLRKHLFKIYRRLGFPLEFYKYNDSCAAITRLLKNKKIIAWIQFCSNLNPSSLLQYLWKTAKRFRNCIQSSTHALNDDRFEDFCARVAPYYVPSESESSPSLIKLSNISPLDQCLNLPLTQDELITTINSRKSIASRVDNISPLMLKYLSATASELLLSILNKLISSNQIPLSWTEFKVNPIPKAHIINFFRPIILPSA
jgi:hypothetical protein